MYVLDANVLFSSLISGKTFYLDVFAKGGFYVPDFVFQELDGYQSLILKRSKFQQEELKLYTVSLFEKLVALPGFMLLDSTFQEVATICASIDPKDVMYVALALELDATLLTRDKKLVDGLQAAGTVKARFFPEFIAALGAPPAG